MARGTPEQLQLAKDTLLTRAQSPARLQAVLLPLCDVLAPETGHVDFLCSPALSALVGDGLPAGPQGPRVLACMDVASAGDAAGMARPGDLGQAYFVPDKIK